MALKILTMIKLSSDITTAEEFFEFLLKRDKYRKRLSRMFLASRDYITVDFMDVVEANIQLAQDLTLEPDKLLSKFSDAAKTQLKIEQPEASVDKIDIRLRELPSTIALRDLNSDYIGKLVQLSGTVVRVTQIQPLVTRACFRCRHCEALSFVPQHKASPFIREPIRCECGKTGLFDFDENKSDWVDYQSIRIQERQ